MENYWKKLVSMSYCKSPHFNSKKTRPTNFSTVFFHHWVNHRRFARPFSAETAAIFKELAEAMPFSLFTKANWEKQQDWLLRSD